MNIVNSMCHIWIGHLSPPLQWMNTWKEKHPDWNYYIFTDEMLRARQWHNQHLITKYYNQGVYAGVADLIRYELLYEQGGFLPPADAICLRNTDELFTAPEDHAYTVFESETIVPNFISPIQACNPENTFVRMLIDELHKLRPEDLHPKPYKSTGNEWLSQFVPDKKKHKLVIWPSHYLIPRHFKKKHVYYDGPDPVYAEQMFGSTKRLYRK